MMCSYVQWNVSFNAMCVDLAWVRGSKNIFCSLGAFLGMAFMQLKEVHVHGCLPETLRYWYVCTCMIIHNIFVYKVARCITTKLSYPSIPED